MGQSMEEGTDSDLRPVLGLYKFKFTLGWGLYKLGTLNSIPKSWQIFFKKDWKWLP